MKAKKGYRRDKTDSPGIGRWLKRYFGTRTCRRREARREFCLQCGDELAEHHPHCTCEGKNDMSEPTVAWEADKLIELASMGLDIKVSSCGREMYADGHGWRVILRAHPAGDPEDPVWEYTFEVRFHPGATAEAATLKEAADEALDLYNAQGGDELFEQALAELREEDDDQ